MKLIRIASVFGIIHRGTPYHRLTGWTGHLPALPVHYIQDIRE